MRPHLFTLFLAVVFVQACTVWAPDYEPDPDSSLRDLLASGDGSAPPLDAVSRERLRFAVERIATRHPGHVASQVAAGALTFRSGESLRAQGYVDRALSLEPAHVEARCLRVRIAVADGSLDLARKLTDEGLRLRPDAAALYESSAWLYQLDGRMGDALITLDTAEALGAPEWRILFNRGLIEELSGNHDGAERHYRAAMETDNGCEEAGQRLAGLIAKRASGRGR